MAMTDEQIKALRDRAATLGWLDVAFKPDTIAELCTRLLSAEDEAAQYKSSLIAQHQAHVATVERVRVLRYAASALIADVKRRHPGEELRCQYMRALDAALQEQSK